MTESSDVVWMCVYIYIYEDLSEFGGGVGEAMGKIVLTKQLIRYVFCTPRSLRSMIAKDYFEALSLIFGT